MVSNGIIKFRLLGNWSAQNLIWTKQEETCRYPLQPLGSILSRSKLKVSIENDRLYKQIRLRTQFQGIELRKIEKGAFIGTKQQYSVRSGQLLISKIDARNGACAIVPETLDEAIITANFWAYDINTKYVKPEYIIAFFSTSRFLEFAERSSNGSTGRHYLNEETFLNFSIPLPPLEEQVALVKGYEKILSAWYKKQEDYRNAGKKLKRYVSRKLGIDNGQDAIPKTADNLFLLMKHSSLQNWNVRNQNFIQRFNSDIYKVCSLEEKNGSVIFVQRGKSPKYKNDSSQIILNQKCIRKGFIDAGYAKTVDTEWYNKYNASIKTHKGDILVNSTGNGTIGRAALIDTQAEGLLYDSHIILLRVDSNVVLPVLLCYFINSEYGQMQVERLKTARTTNQTELGVTNLLKMRFPFPPIKVQKTISNYIVHHTACPVDAGLWSNLLIKAGNYLVGQLYNLY